MNGLTFLGGEIRAAVRRMGESAQATREAVEAAQERMTRAEIGAEASDVAMVELAGLMDTALTCVDEQNAALVELAGLMDAGTEGV